MVNDPAQRLSRSSRIRRARRLVLVLGDQLDPNHPGLEDLDTEHDAVLMIEAQEESEQPANHLQRTTLFLSAMRHYALDLLDRNLRLRYVPLDHPDNQQTLGGALSRALEALTPEEVRVVQPGDHRVLAAVQDVTAAKGVDLEVLPDPSFTCELEEFDRWADDGRKELTMEFFYRERRRELGVLVHEDGKPVGGAWNFDKENRKAFKQAPEIPPPYRARPDDVTRGVIELVRQTWPDAPGRLDGFAWPVTRDQARRALDSFIERRLPSFGTYEDAMWEGEPVLYHSRLSSSLNLKLLRPLECVDAALDAYEDGSAALNDVEGFVRQIIGWREFIRGVYYHEGPGYLDRNGLRQYGALPDFFWTAQTDLNCLAHCIDEVLTHGWGHHIPRLMVIGNFTLMAGVHPRAVNDWFLGMYVDAVDWVTAPNVIGMSQHADHGVVGTKPYIASGKYIHRMSNYCKGCRYDVNRTTGEDACPYNALYWDFLNRHEESFAGNRRMGIALSNLRKLGAEEREAISGRARDLRQKWGVGPISR